MNNELRCSASRPYLRTHQGHGLEDELCGGDISLIFCHTPSTAECDESVITKQRNLDKLVQQVRVGSTGKLSLKDFILRILGKTGTVSTHSQR